MPSSKFHPRQILMNTKAEGSLIAQHVLAAHPDAEVIPIRANTHAWNGKASSLQPEDFYAEKRHKVAVLHRGATWKPDPNGRSTDFLPNIKLGTGCGFFCEYCYVERKKPNSFPKVYDDAFNIVNMVQYVLDNEDFYHDHFQNVCRKPFEKYRDKDHGPYITFDLGCDTDCVIDNQITAHAGYVGHVVDIMNQIGALGGAMTSFATKGTYLKPFIEGCEYKHRNRIRLSLSPEHHRRVLEVNTAMTGKRLEAVNELVAAGFDVHINLSPIVVTDDFEQEYTELLQLIDDTLIHEAKCQLAYECIFLTHSYEVYDAISQRNPAAHAFLAEGPVALKAKPHKPSVTTYPRKDKNQLKRWLHDAISRITPYARVRYIF